MRTMEIYRESINAGRWYAGIYILSNKAWKWNREGKKRKWRCRTRYFDKEHSSIVLPSMSCSPNPMRKKSAIIEETIIQWAVFQKRIGNANNWRHCTHIWTISRHDPNNLLPRAICYAGWFGLQIGPEIVCDCARRADATRLFNGPIRRGWRGGQERDRGLRRKGKTSIK